MAARHWLLKSEPEVYPYAALESDGHTVWDGVRNFTARRNLSEMSPGDLVLFYHSHATEVVGVARVRRAAFPDPTADDPRWLAVEIEAVEALPNAVSLEVIRADPQLAKLPLLTQSRLSVMPVEPAQFARIVALAKSGARRETAAPAAASTRSSGAKPRSRPRARRR
jgi:predicted RNA-binding protein with PUA-like domain